MDNTETSKKVVIDRFLADNPELEELSARLSTFNVFKALRIEKAEIRHSNILAWLLTPDESHGLGNVVLRRVFSNILLESDKSIEEISAAQVELMDFSDIEIRREWRNIDILVIDRSNKLTILIENKIYARESKGQLEKYLRIIEEEFPSFTKIPVFLTLMGDDTSDDITENYICYSHLQLLSVLERIFSQRQSQLADPVTIFLNQYMDLLRRLTMQDESLVNLCKTIYKTHRDAIDLIVEYGKGSVGQEVVEEFLTEEKEYEVLCPRSKWVWFLPRNWSRIVPENGTAWKHLTRPVSIVCFFLFQSNRNKIHLMFEVSQMKDADLRLACVRALKGAGFKLGEKAFRKDAKYSRFFSQSVNVPDMNDYENVRKAAEKLLKKAKVEFPKAEKVFQAVFK